MISTDYTWDTGSVISGVREEVPDKVKKAFEEADKYFPTEIQKFQFYDKYSRFDYALGRRETWIETVNRAVDYLKELSEGKLDESDYQLIRTYVLNMWAAPSMRLLAMAGPAARRQAVSIYNCSYLTVDSIDSYVEALIISMSGCGVGFSVEKQNVTKLPEVKKQTGELHIFTVEDSTEGWAEALRLGLTTWFEGRDVVFDYSLIRPEGSPLRIKGGTASGPKPLRELLDFARNLILSKQGSKLTSLNAHDIMCAVGSAAVAGGVRRTAMISLFDWDDEEMRDCKNGENIVGNDQRWNANNSAVWPDNLSQIGLASQMIEMAKGQRGEPGIFSRENASNLRPERREDAVFGTNPCLPASERILTPDGYTTFGELFNLGTPNFVIADDGVSYKDDKYAINTKNFGSSIKFATQVELTRRDAEIQKIKTFEGFELRLTSNHKVATPNGMVEAKNLKNDEKILISLPRAETSVSGRDPETLDEKAAYLMGLITGDGTTNTTKKGTSLVYLDFWGTDATRMADKVQKIIKEMYDVDYDSGLKDYSGYNSSIATAWRTKTRALVPSTRTNSETKVRIQSSWLSTYLTQKYAFDKHEVPEIVLRYSRKKLSQFYVAGLFYSDGSVHHYGKMRRSVRLSQSNFELLQKIQLILQSNGIFSYIYSRRPAQFRLMPNGKGGNKEYFTKENFELIISTNTDVFENVIGFLGHPEKTEKLKVMNTGRELIRDNIRTVRVKSVEFDGYEDVYCLNQPDTHSIIVQGITTQQCGEINLRSRQFCNLSIAIARIEDTFETLMEKVRVATIIGTIQSMALNFKGLSKEWIENCAKERLLGVDITGQMDCPAVQDANVLSKLKDHAIAINKEYAEKLGIPQSVSVTCVKPSGNSSQLFNCSSGLHARWAPFYIRNIRVGVNSPIFSVLKELNVPMDPENGQTHTNASTFVIHFPVKAPDGALTRKERGAIEQCEYWLLNKKNWTEHNPSVTISYHPDELIDLIKWVSDHKKYIGGMAFLPIDDAQYAQMPYEEISEQEYYQRLSVFPKIDFSRIWLHEKTDHTTAAQEVACVSGACSIDDIPNGPTSQQEYLHLPEIAFN